ncbi:hypothetical protein DQK32_27225, partial [Salmonella enterica subsp. enterica serovar Newport]|nr:hypothetical protein [Salmonella enterica subsp. enterica serovar Newport]
LTKIFIKRKFILENSDNVGFLSCKAKPLKSTSFTLSSLVMALFLTSNIAYAESLNTASSGAQASGLASTATGENSVAQGSYSTATGFSSVAQGKSSTATGNGARASGDSSTATGKSSLASMLGSTATGSSSQARGKDSTATGAATFASGQESTATGYAAYATGDNSVALGAHSSASNDNEVNIGIWSVNPLTQTAIKQTGTRTISGLSAGVNDDEAVNLQQLNKAAQDVKTEANVYTDDTAKKTVQSVNDNTERRAVVAENNAVTLSKTYTDENSVRTLESA